MKVLLVTVTAGQGHNATAAAVSDSLRARGAEVVIIDMFKYVSRFLYNAVDKGYTLTTRISPSQFGKMYRNMENDNFWRRSVIAFLTSEIVSDTIFGHVNSIRPDAVISTHPFAAQVIDELMQQRVLQTNHVGIITDYTIQPFWEDIRHIDGIVICSELMSYRAVQRGIRPEKLLPFGIPVNERFGVCKDKEQARKELGLHPEMRTALFMSGSMGFGNMAEQVRRVACSNMAVQIVCVCGNNDKLVNRLRSERFPQPVRALGFIDNVHDYMDACDVVITKPGGITVSEAMVKHKPLILTAPIPGVEEENADYLVNHGLALRATRNISVHELIYILFAYPKRLEQMRLAIEGFARTDSTRRLCDYICSKLSPPQE